MTKYQSDAFKKAMRDVTNVIDAKLAERQIATARRIAAAVRRNSKDSEADNRFLKGLRIRPLVTTNPRTIDPGSVKARLAELHLRDYLEFVVWPILEPATPFVGGWPIDAMCEHLEAVTDEEIRHLLITIPPRHTKSTTVSIAWPTWSWIGHPEIRFMFGSSRQSSAPNTRSAADVSSSRASTKGTSGIASSWSATRTSRPTTRTAGVGIESRRRLAARPSAAAGIAWCLTTRTT